MAHTVHTSLGSSSLSGNQAISQARKFKEQLRSIYDKPASVSLVSVVHLETPHIEVVAQHDADDAVASAWVRHAKEVADGIWGKLNERRKGATQGVRTMNR